MNFPAQGHFWLPASPKRPVYGTLTFARRTGALLKLADSLSADRNEIEHPIIVGQTAGGSFVTLLHGIRTEAPMIRLTPTNPCSYHATFLINGAAFGQIDDLRFSLWQIRLPELTSWVARHGFEIESSEVSSGGERPAVRIDYRTPQKHVLLSNTNPELSLVYFPLLKTGQTQAEIKQDVCVEVRHSSGDTLEDFMRTTTRFEHFLTLATGSLVRTGRIKALAKTIEPAVSVDILYQPVRKATGSELARDEMLFSLKDIEGLEETCLRNWFAKAEWLDPVCALYFGTLYNPSKYLDFNFLALVQALEAYHRRASVETDKAPAEHEARLAAIMEVAPAEHRDWLTEKLQFSNELSLRRRLKGLFARFAYVIDELVPDRKSLIGAICDNRNYLTHYTASLRGRAFAGAQLLFMVESLKLLLQASFLHEVGFADDRIKVCLVRSRTTRMIQHLAERIAKSGAEA